MTADNLEFNPLRATNYVQICEILFDGKCVGIERTEYPKSIANPFVSPIYRYLREDLIKPYGAEPIGDAYLAVSRQTDENNVGFMIPGWSTIEAFVASFAEYPFVEKTQP